MQLDRRRLLVSISAVMGGALSSGAVKALDAAMNIGETVDVSDYEFRALNTEQVKLLRAVMDTILPATDTPGAVGVGVDVYIDQMLAEVLSPTDGLVVPAFLEVFHKKVPQFLSMSANERLKALGEIDAKLRDKDTFHQNYKAVKELTLIGYYTSEIGATEELAYDPVPGPFHVVSTEDYNRNWAT
jgi:hypothetical protein